MGRLFEFGCEQCGYQAEVSGGEDAGWLILTQTMTCLNCKRVVDVTVGESHPGSLRKRYSHLGPLPPLPGPPGDTLAQNSPLPQVRGEHEEAVCRAGVLLGLIMACQILNATSNGRLKLLD
jgi:hypothetical protein